MDGARWVSTSRFGSPYEEECDANSHPLVYRHRKRPLNRPTWAMNQEPADSWQSGPAPDRGVAAVANPKATLEAKMRKAADALREIEADIPGLYPKAHRSLHRLSEMIATLDEFAESIKVERTLDGA